MAEKPGPASVRASTKSPTTRRALGSRAEQAVLAHLEAQGVEILAVNLRVGHLELDLVAREGPVIVVIEVRTRGPGAWVRALDSVDAKKRERLRRAAEGLWRRRFARDPTVERMRFDVAAVDLDDGGGARVEIVKAAF